MLECYSMSSLKKKSSQRAVRRHLDSAAMEVLLQRWVNLPDSPDLKSRAELLVKHYPEIFEELQPLAGENIFNSIVGIRNHLRAVWDAPTDRDREWYCFRLRQLYAQHLAASRTLPVAEALKRLREAKLAQIQDQESFYAIGRGARHAGEMLSREIQFWGIRVEPPPQPTHFERLVYTLQRLGRRARHCENSDCQWPYFFASRRTQRYCSNACAVPAQREAKRRWWDSNREEQLRKRRETRGSSRQSKKRRKS